jgi:hypothetical protein
VVPSGQLSISDFAVRVLAATGSAGSVHAERVERTHGERTEITADTRFDRAHYQGRMTLVTARKGQAKNASTDRSELRLLRGRVYAHVAGVFPRGRFLPFALNGTRKEIGDLCSCMFGHVEPTTTLQTMTQSLTKVDYLGREERSGLTLEHYRLEANTVMIPGAVDASHPPTTRVYQVWLDSKHLMRRMSYSTIDMTVDVTYSNWGEPVHVQPPAANQILRVPGAGSTDPKLA